MLEVKTSKGSLYVFLALTGHAFDERTSDTNRTHGFYWAQRWLARQVLGPTWMGWLTA